MVVVVVMVVGEVDVLFCVLIGSSAALLEEKRKNRKGDCEFRGVYYRKKEKKNQPQTTHGLSACRAGHKREGCPVATHLLEPTSQCCCRSIRFDPSRSF